MHHSKWLLLVLPLVIAPPVLSAATQADLPDKEMLKMMDLLREMEMIKQLEMMRELDRAESLGEQAKGPLPAKPDLAKKKGVPK